MREARMDTRVFIERLSPSLRPAAQGLDLTALLEDVLRRASERWPQVRLEPKGFFEHVGTKGQGDVARAPEALHVEDLYLAAGCVAGDAAALRAFEQTFFTSHHPDELKAVLRERLLVRRADGPARIATYSGQAPLESWFKVAAARASMNLARSEAPRANETSLMM